MAYQSVYLKAHHPLPYLKAVLNAGGGYYSLPVYIEEAKRLGIKILPPDVACSDYNFEEEDGCIRVGLLSIKCLKTSTAKKIIEERRRGPYRSLDDFLARVSVTRAELFSLVKSGALDSLEPRRAEQVLNGFKGGGGTQRLPGMEKARKERMLIDSLGFDPAGDALDLFSGKRPALRIKDLEHRAGQIVELLVRVMDARRKRIRQGAAYFFLFSDETGMIEGAGTKKCLPFGSPPACYVRGRIRRSGNGRVKIFNCTFLSVRE